MYEEWGGAPAAGTITGLGRVAGRQVMIIANDATVKAGAFFPMTAKKVIRAQNIAIENRIPTIYLVDSAGVFLPLQEDVFPDTDDFGRVFRNNAVMSAHRHSADYGDHGNVRRGRRLPSGDVRPHPDDGRLRAFPCRSGAGAGGDRTENFRGRTRRRENARADQRHGGFSRAGRRSLPGANSRACGQNRPAPGRSVRSQVAARPPAHPGEEIYGIFSSSPAKQYDMREIIARIVDGSEFEEYRAEYGQTVLCGYARIGGWAVGIVANQKKHVTSPLRAPAKSASNLAA